MCLMRSLAALPLLILLASPARACWDSPTAACFSALWQDRALAYHGADPGVQRLYDLIDWGVVPPGEKAARALLSGLSHDDLAAHQNAQAGSAAATEQSRAEQALRLLLGLEAGSPPEVSSGHLVAIYRLALAANDRALAQKWYAHLPDYLQDAPDLPAPDGSTLHLDPYVAAQARAISALTDLRAGRVEQATRVAAGITGEPGFVTWLALARHAIAQNDTLLLTRATQGLTDTLAPADAPPFDEEAFERALQAAEAEFAQTGNPEALVAVLESADHAAFELPTGARITAALAQRHLHRLTGAATDDGFDAALEAMRQALQTREDEDDATPMLNARTALRLGMTDEAERLIAMVDAHFPGVAGVFLHDMPAEPSPWAGAWLDRMIARVDHVIANPDEYDTRAYWDIWLDQDALDTLIDITQTLARYDRRDEAHDFAERARAYLQGVSTGAGASDHAAIFERETAAFLFPWDVALPRLRRLEADTSTIARAFARANRGDIALKLLATMQGYRALDQWIDHGFELQDPWREDYITLLRPLIEEEAARLTAAGYPGLAQAHHAKAAVFYARIGDWPAARSHYEQITDVEGKNGLTPGIQNRLTVLREIATLLSPLPAPVAYPYEDFAL